MEAEIKLKQGATEMFKRVSGLQTESAIAGAIGVSYDSYNKIKNGRQNPSTAFIAGACLAFGLPIESFAEPVAVDMEDAA